MRTGVQWQRAALKITSRSLGPTILLVFGLAGCASSGREGIIEKSQGRAGLAGLPWPPHENSVVSPDAWTELELKGIDYTSIGGAHETAANLIRLKDGDGLAYALYSVPAGPAAWPLSLTLNYGLEPRAGGNHCDAWLALANYALGRWELHKADAAPYIFALADTKSYVSPGGYCHAAVVFDGEGKVRVDSLLFQRYENPLDSPPGFRLNTESGTVELAWGASVGADGYKLYKSAESDFAAASLLTETQVLEYSDSAVAPEERCFYWGTALQDGVESLPSGPLCAVLPVIDLPMPKDFWSPGSAAESFDLAWDWEGLNPDGFILLMAVDEPNFDPSGPGLKTFSLAGTARSYTLGQPDVGSLHVYYCRLAAFDLQGLSKTTGHWTKALPCSVDNIVWAFPETLGPGSAPVRADRTSDGLVAVWFDAGTLICGQRDSGGNWTVSDTGLNPMLETYPGQLVPHMGFDQFLDIAWNNGVCLVCAHSADTGDLWAAIGNPGGAWTQELALGDRDPIGGTNGGVNLDCAAGPGSAGTGEYSVTCAVFPRDGFGFPQTFLASRPASGGAGDWRSFDLSAEAPQLDSCNYPTCVYGQDDNLLHLCLFADANGEGGEIVETLKLGYFDTVAEAPAPQWDLVKSDGTDWGGPFPYTSYCVPSQVQLVQTVAPRPGSSDGPYKAWQSVGYSESQMCMGIFTWIYHWQNPAQATSGPQNIALFDGESTGWYPRQSLALVGGYPSTFHLLAWNESRGENYLRQEQFGGFVPPYCPIPLPGMPGALSDILCLDESVSALLYADLHDGLVKCAIGTDPAS